MNSQMFELDLEKAEDQISNCQHPLDHRKAKGIPEKISASLTMLKPLTVWITANCGKFLKRWKYQTTLPASWEICLQVKKQKLEPDMEQQSGSKLGKEYIKAVYCHPAYFNLFAEYIMQNAWLDEAQVGIKIARRNSCIVHGVAKSQTWLKH